MKRNLEKQRQQDEMLAKI